MKFCFPVEILYKWDLWIPGVWLLFFFIAHWETENFEE